MIKPLVKLFNALGANTNPGEIAHAMSCGILLGLMPKNNLLWYLVLVFILFIRINKPAYAVSLLVGSALAPLLDPAFDAIGYAFLTVPAFSGFFGTLLDVPFVALTKFNNTIVMGAFLAGIILYVPLYFLCRALIFLWRQHVVPFMQKSKLGKLVVKLPLISKIAGLAGGN